MDDDDSEIKIITPPVAETPLDDMLVALTEAISKRDPDLLAHGALGGEFGYGARYENDVFVMRPFYWGDCDCGADDADAERPHADTCAILLPNFLHKKSGLRVCWYKWIGRDMEIENAPAELSAIFAECLASLPA